MALYALRRGGDTLCAAGEWNPRRFSRALDGVGVRVSLSAPAPAAGFTVPDTDPAVQVAVLPDRPAHDPEFCSAAWDEQAGQWSVSWKSAAQIRAILLARGRARARQGVVAQVPVEELVFAALDQASAGEKTALQALIADWRNAYLDHKAALDALSTVAGLVAYDLSAGWPE